MIRKHFPDAALTTDIIAGFPDESDNDFEESLSFAKKIGFLKIHAFPYSPKRGTPAAAMENQIQNSVKNERTARLIELSDIMGEEFIERFKGRNMPVLFEREISENLYEGYTVNYIRVIAESKENIQNKILDEKEYTSEAEKIILSVTSALEEKGYNPVNQLVGYILSGDPTYITSYKNARSIIRKLERDELLEEIIKDYLKRKA